MHFNVLTHHLSIIIIIPIIITSDRYRPTKLCCKFTHMYFLCACVRITKGYIKIIAEETQESLKSSSLLVCCTESFRVFSFSLSLQIQIVLTHLRRMTIIKISYVIFLRCYDLILNEFVAIWV